MKIRLLFLLVGVLLFVPVFAQLAPAIEWQRCLGGSEIEQGYALVETSDGGCIVAGYTSSIDGDVTENLGITDCWIVKLNSSGAIEWQRSYGGSDEEEAHSIAQTTEGGYIIAGYSRSSDGDVNGNHGLADCWILKLESTGNIEWEKTFGGSNFDSVRSIAQTSDGGYIAAGFTLSIDGDVTNNHGSYDAWVLKLDNSGTIEWERACGGSDNDGAAAIAQTMDGGYIFAGWTKSTDGDVTNNNGIVDYWIVKLSFNGTLEWQKALGGSSIDDAYSVAQTNDGGYIVAGTTQSADGDVTYNHGSADLWVVKLDDSGILEWQKSLGGSFIDWAYSIAQTGVGGYIVGGRTHSIIDPAAMC